MKPANRFRQSFVASSTTSLLRTSSAFSRNGGSVSVTITRSKIRPEVDEFFAVMTPKDFSGVGQWYEDFSPTTDEGVRELLEKASQLPTASRS